MIKELERGQSRVHHLDLYRRSQGLCGGPQRNGQRFYRLANAVPTLLMIGKNRCEMRKEPSSLTASLNGKVRTTWPCSSATTSVRPSGSCPS